MKPQQRMKPLPRPKCQPKVIRDSNPDFRINPYSYADTCRGSLLCIYYGVSRFAQYRVNRLVTVQEMLINPLNCNDESSGNVIRNPYPVPDHQKLINYSDRWINQYQVILHTDRTNDRQTALIA